MPFNSLQLVSVPGDGNCFFHAVCDQLLGTPLETDAATLRRELTDRAIPLLQQMVTEGFIMPGSLQTLVDASYAQGTDVRDEIVPTLSSCFNVDLVVYQRDGSVLQHFTSTLQPPVAVVRLLLHSEHYTSLRAPLQVPGPAASSTPKPCAKSSWQKLPASLPGCFRSTTGASANVDADSEVNEPPVFSSRTNHQKRPADQSAETVPGAKGTRGQKRPAMQPKPPVSTAGAGISADTPCNRQPMYVLLIESNVQYLITYQLECSSCNATILNYF